MRRIVLAFARRHYAALSKHKFVLAPIVYFVYGLRWLAYLFRTKADNVICLSLGENGGCASVLYEARNRGYRTVLFAQKPLLQELLLTDRWVKIDALRQDEKIANAAKSFAPRAILVEGKHLVLPTQDFLSSRLGLVSVGTKAAHTSNDKIFMRECLDLANSLLGVRWQNLTSSNSLEDFPFPAVVKPSKGVASRGVKYVYNSEEVRAALSENKKFETDISVGNQHYLEEYVDGEQYDVEGIACSGRFHVLCIIREYYEGEPPYFPPKYFLFNPPITDERKRRLETSAVEALQCLGVQNGAWHCEFRINNEGRIFLLDYANRMGYPNLVSVAAGCSFEGNYLDIMAENFVQPPVISPKVILYYYINSGLAQHRRLAKNHPELVQKSSFEPFSVSVTTYQGYLSLVASRYETIWSALTDNHIEIEGLPIPKFLK